MGWMRSLPTGQHVVSMKQSGTLQKPALTAKMCSCADHILLLDSSFQVNFATALKLAEMKMKYVK